MALYQIHLNDRTVLSVMKDTLTELLEDVRENKIKFAKDLRDISDTGIGEARIDGYYWASKDVENLIKKKMGATVLTNGLISNPPKR